MRSRRKAWILATMTALVMWPVSPAAATPCIDGSCLSGRIAGSGVSDPVRMLWRGQFEGYEVVAGQATPKQYSFVASATYEFVRDLPLRVARGTLELYTAVGTAYSFPIEAYPTDAGWAFQGGRASTAGSYTSSDGHEYMGSLVHQSG